MAEIMLTKLLPPRIGGELIERLRLLDLLVRNREVKLILITAPAGYGKTVLTLQYANTLKTPFVWYQLDSYDNDPVVFIQYLITGIQNHFPGFGAKAMQLALQNNLRSSLRLVVTAIVNELASCLTGNDLGLILDDYHLIASPVIHQCIQELIEHLPAGVRLIITSRIAPDLSLPRLQVRGEMALIDSDILRFTPEEVDEYLSKRQANAAAQQSIDSLISKANGWPAALKLLTDTISPKSQALSDKETKYIYDYLANEVFDQQPETIREFLVSTAVLEIMTPQLCNLLLERSDSGQVLDDLEKQQLFLIPLTGPEKAYRYHQLFRDFLLNRLGPQKDLLFRKAGAITLNKGNLDQAIEYYLTAGVNQDILSLLEKGAKEALRQGRWQTVERWLEMLPREQISNDEWLCFFQAQIKIYQGKLDEAEIWISKSLAGFSLHQDVIGTAECEFQKARIYNQHDRVAESLALLEKAYPVLVCAEPFLRFDLPLEMGLTLFKNGRLQEAEAVLAQALQQAMRQNDSLIMAHLYEGLGHIYYWMGENSKAIQCYQKGIRISPTQTLPSYNFQDFTSDIYLEWGEIELALEYAQRSVAFKEKMGLFEPLPSAYLQLGGVYLFSGEVEKAEACMRKGIALAEKSGGERLFLSMNKGFVGFCLMMKGQLAEALALAEEVLSEAQSQSDLLLASCVVICAPILIANGESARAKDLLIKAILPLEKYKFAIPLSYAYANLALIHFQNAELQEAGALSRQVLELAASKNLIQHFLTNLEFQVFLRYGMENGIEVSFIQRILVRLRERALDLLTKLAAHHDPQVRLRTVFPLSQINNAASQHLIANLSNDPNPEIKRTIKQYAQLLGETGFSDAISLTGSANLLGDVNLLGDASLPGAFANLPEDNSPGQNSTKSAAVSPKAAIHKETWPVIGREDTATAPILQIFMLGPVRIILNHTDITTKSWRLIKSRDLLLYLVHQGQAVGINRILEDLWPDLTMEKALNNFYGALHQLRQIIQKDGSSGLVTYVSKSCQLTPSVFMVDRDRFIALINAGSGPLTVSSSNLRSLEEAIALYQGDYLCQLDYPWVIPEREHLKRLYLETALRLAKFYLQSQDYLKTVGILESLAEQNPLREEIFGLLMSAYAKLGDRLAVIRQFQKLKSNLVEELGLEPAPEITKLYYELCGSDSKTRGRLKKA